MKENAELLIWEIGVNNKDGSLEVIKNSMIKYKNIKVIRIPLYEVKNFKES